MSAAASQSKPREERAKVMLTAALVDSRGSRQAQISDISPRGLLGNMDAPPQRGEFVNIRLPSREVAGQVRWVQGRNFGVRLRERIDVASVTGGGRAPRAAVRLAADETEPSMSLQGTLVAYGVLGLTALSIAYLIVTYIIY